MSICSKDTKKKKNPTKKTEHPQKNENIEVTTNDVSESVKEQINAPEPQDPQINPMIIPEFFNNIRNNYYAANKIIWLTGEIVWENVTEVMRRLNFYEDGTKDEITIYIASPGGLCDAGWALVDMIEKIKKRGVIVKTICAGSCSSMAAVLLAAGSKGHRYAFPSARVMIHQAGFGLNVGGRLDEMANEVRELQYWTDLTSKYLAKVCGKKVSDVAKELTYDNYMSANEAKKFGIVDKVDVVLA